MNPSTLCVIHNDKDTESKLLEKKISSELNLNFMILIDFIVLSKWRFLKFQSQKKKRKGKKKKWWLNWNKTFKWITAYMCIPMLFINVFILKIKKNEVNNMYLITFIKVIKWNWLHYKNRINAIDKNIVGFEIVISYNLE